MKTSVIVCSYGGNEDLVESCMASLECQTYQPDEKILVVDTEEEKEIYSNSNLLHNTRVVCSGKRGLAAARNRGIEESIGDIIAFIDDDAVADKNWLYEIINSFSGSNDAAVVGGPVKPIFRGKKIKEKLNWIIGCTSNSPPTERPIGCNMAFDKSVFNTMGGFNENLGRVKEKLAIGEETELFLRIMKYNSDAKIIYNPDAVVYHEVPEKRTKVGYMMRRAYEEGLAKAVIGKKHGLDTEQNYIKYYVKNMDLITFWEGGEN
ncbi:glycosyltransferase family 2 protein [ANME-1 cluster archaeon GoMg4]|nr:glycosyltransferase family 2 protein [ANME-1 cluster archaeon GoMg4]